MFGQEVPEYRPTSHGRLPCPMTRSHGYLSGPLRYLLQELSLPGIRFDLQNLLHKLYRVIAVRFQKRNKYVLTRGQNRPRGYTGRLGRPYTAHSYPLRLNRLSAYHPNDQG